MFEDTRNSFLEMTETGDNVYPFKVEKLNKEDNDAIKNYMEGLQANYITIGPKKYFFPEYYMNEAAKIYNLKLRSDDTFVATYPKSGTTWMQELVWLLKNNLDFEKAKSTRLHDRFFYLEVKTKLSSEEFYKENPDPMILSYKAYGTRDVKQISELLSPRFIKTHTPLSLLPPTLLDTVKVVYVARDPRDVAVSFYHNFKLVKWLEADADFKSHWNFFMNGQVLFTPYFKHVLEAWEKRNHPNLLFLFYEDLLKDLPAGIRRVAQFLGKELTEQQVDVLNEHLQFDNFKKNKSVNLQEYQEEGLFRAEGGFVRKGKSGDWREHFDEEMTAQADKWIEDNLRDTDFRFPHM